MIIVLEDMPHRHSSFLQKHPDAVICETAELAMRKIQEAPSIRYLFLDHDLGGESNVDTADKNTGSEVVRFLVANKATLIKKINAIIVHSMNGPAGEEMFRKLQDAGYYAQLIRFLTLESQYLFK